MAKVKKGMSIEGVRQIWLPRAEAKTHAIMEKYYARREGSGGREGLGIYGLYKERAAREKVKLASRLLQQAGLEVTISSISRVTGQSRRTVSNHWTLPAEPDDPTPTSDEGPPQRVIRFPGTW